MRPSRLRWLAAAVPLALLAVLVVAVRAPGTATPASALVGHAAPELSGPTLDGHQVRLRQLRGRVVLVNVWASWCAACADELPLLAQTQQRLGPRGLTVLGVATRDGAAPARNLLRKVGASSLASIVDPSGRLAVDWGIRGVPETFLVDRSGTVRARRIGAVTEEWLQTAVEPLLRT